MELVSIRDVTGRRRCKRWLLRRCCVENVCVVDMVQNAISVDFRSTLRIKVVTFEGM
jgi:hypothetical protein